MAWTQAGSIKGPKGDTGDQGPKGDTGATGAAGAAGADGKSVTITGHVTTATALPTGLTSADAGKGWITDDDGHLHVWSGTAFTDVGNVRGPKGDTGATGADGAQGPKGDTGDTGAAGATGGTGATGTRGSQWYTGTGAPGSIPGSIPGDMYLDTSTGTVYQLA